MAGPDDGVVGEGEEDVPDRPQQGFQVAAGQIRATNGTGEQGIADEQRRRISYRQAHPTRAVSRRVQYPHVVASESQRPVIEAAACRLRLDAQCEHWAL